MVSTKYNATHLTATCTCGWTKTVKITKGRYDYITNIHGAASRHLQPKKGK